MQIIADLHTHTNVTDHAFSTLTEMVQAAEDRTSGISPIWTLSRARSAR